MTGLDYVVLYGAAFVIPLAATLVFTPLAAGLARKLGILDRPGERKVHVEATPVPRRPRGRRRPRRGRARDRLDGAPGGGHRRLRGRRAPARAAGRRSRARRRAARGGGGRAGGRALGRRGTGRVLRRAGPGPAAHGRVDRRRDERAQPARQHGRPGVGRDGDREPRLLRHRGVTVRLPRRRDGGGPRGDERRVPPPQLPARSDLPRRCGSAPPRVSAGGARAHARPGRVERRPADRRAGADPGRAAVRHGAGRRLSRARRPPGPARAARTTRRIGSPRSGSPVVRSRSPPTGRSWRARRSRSSP